MRALAVRSKDLAVLQRTLARFGFVRSARVFGSRATGSARRSSDLDLAIEAPDASPSQWLELREALEQAPLIYELDVVRYDQALNPRLRQRIQREGVTIYSAP